MRVFVVVLALFVLACQQQPRYKLETRGGQTLRVDTQTGETARLENGAWVAMGTGTTTPQSTGLPDSDIAGIRVSAVQTGEYLVHLTIDNETAWNLTGVTMTVSSFHMNAGIPYGQPIRPGQRFSSTANLVQQYPPSNGTNLTVKVLSAEGHR